MNALTVSLFMVLLHTVAVQHPSGIRDYRQGLKSNEEIPVCKVVGMEELNRRLEDYNPYMVVEKPIERPRVVHFNHSTGEMYYRDRRSTDRKRVKLTFAGVLSDDVLNREKKDLRAIELDEDQADRSVSTTTPPPWSCAKEKKPIKLPIDYYPDEVDNFVCTPSICWSDFFHCRETTMNITVFKLRDCIPAANSPNILKKFWDQEMMTVTSGCECRSRY